MSEKRIPDKALMTPKYIAHLIRNAYIHGVTDGQSSPNDTKEALYANSSAKVFVDRYQDIARRELERKRIDGFEREANVEAELAGGDPVDILHRIMVEHGFAKDDSQC